MGVENIYVCYTGQQHSLCCNDQMSLTGYSLIYDLRLNINPVT